MIQIQTLAIQFAFPSPLHPSSMQRHRQNPKTPKRNPAAKHKPKSKTQPPVFILPMPSSDDDDRSSVCSNSSRHRRIAAEQEEIRIREELEDEIERELEQELIDGISVLVRRLTELKARQISRGVGIVSCGGGFTEKVEREIAGGTRRWVAASFSEREGAVGFGGDDGCESGERESGCSDAESTTRIVLR